MSSHHVIGLFRLPFQSGNHKPFPILNSRLVHVQIKRWTPGETPWKRTMQISTSRCVQSQLFWTCSAGLLYKLTHDVALRQSCFVHCEQTNAEKWQAFPVLVMESLCEKRYWLQLWVLYCYLWESGSCWMSNISFTKLHAPFLASSSIGRGNVLKENIAGFLMSCWMKSLANSWMRCVCKVPWWNISKKCYALLCADFTYASCPLYAGSKTGKWPHWIGKKSWTGVHRTARWHRRVQNYGSNYNPWCVKATTQVCTYKL